jgi:hypothetical protein
MDLAQPQATGAACVAGRVFIVLVLRGRSTGQLLRTQIGAVVADADRTTEQADGAVSS